MKKILIFLIFIFFLSGCSASQFVYLTMPNNEKIKARLAITAVEFNKGLSGIDRLDGYNAMFFIKDQAEQVCFWMKDMRFPLDILYLDDRKTVLEILNNLAPCLTSEQCESFCSKNDQVKYILELPAGQLEKFNLHVNSIIK